MRVLALANVALFVPFAVVLGYLTTDPVFSYGVNLYLFDVPLALLVAATLPRFLARARRLELGAALWSVLAALVAISFVAHPSLEGIQTVLRLCGTLAIAVTYADLMPEERGLVIGVLALATLVETVIAVAQAATGGPLGLTLLFESPKPLNPVGASWLPKGTMQTPYLLTALSLVCALLVAGRVLSQPRPRAWAALVAAVAVPVGITYSRAALGALVAAAGALVPRGRVEARRRLAILALVAGVAVPAAFNLSGWTARGEQFGEERADSGRGILLLQGLTVFASEPLTGVGPGRYMAAVRTLTTDDTLRRKLLPTHAVPLLVAAESGAFAGAAVLVLIGALGLRALRDRDDVGIALYLVLFPFWLLDVLPYTLPQGLILTGLWLGGLDVAHRERAS